MLLTIAFFACAIACAIVSRRTDEGTTKIAVAAHSLITLSYPLATALGIHVAAGHAIPPSAARAAFVWLAVTLSFSASLYEGWHFPSARGGGVRWFKIIALAAATLAIYVAAAQ